MCTQMYWYSFFFKFVYYIQNISKMINYDTNLPKVLRSDKIVHLPSLDRSDYVKRITKLQASLGL